MNKLAIVLVAVLAFAAVAHAGDVVVVNPQGGEVKNIRVGEGGQPGGQAYYGYYAAYATPAPVPPGVASVYNVPCATPYTHKVTITPELLLSGYGERRGQ